MVLIYTVIENEEKGVKRDEKTLETRAQEEKEGQKRITDEH